jgi:hypothetical protein
VRGTDEATDIENTGDGPGAAGVPGGGGPDGSELIGVGEDGSADESSGRHVYIIGSRREGPLKIGISTNDTIVRSRL